MSIIRRPALALFAALSLWPALAHAQSPADSSEAVDSATAANAAAHQADKPKPARLTYQIWGDRLDASGYPDNTDEQLALRQLMRGRLDLGNKTFGMHVEADLLSGQLAGDWGPRVPNRADTETQANRDPFGRGQVVDPREFYARWRTEVGELRAGLQTSQWGLGLVANSGSLQNEDIFNQRFGGDRVVRAVFATAPLRPLLDSSVAENIYWVLGADLVWRDENADFIAGDRAVQGMSALFYRDEDTQGGVYAAYRDQDDRSGDFLQVWVFDAYADHVFSAGEDFRFRAAAEVALMHGETSRTWAPNADPIGVMALGAAAELEALYKPLDLGVQLHAGYASGDANSDDDTLYRFRFDPNYQVGMVLFDHYMPAVSRASVDGIFDPERSGYAPKGIDGLISDGGVENAYYLSPRLSYGGEDGFMAAASLLWAQAAQPISDPYASFANGGDLVGINGVAPASDDLGVELDAAARYRFSPVDPLTLEIKGEYGIFFPGEAFADQEGDLADPQSLVRVRLAAMW
ncbi:hypothetical protein [Bradymonas sediminis]|uniref:Uncharacterized protein n=1 Tax=Bradymonas sediminis TaxID=1548548 RepID=A0A2Z4FRE0_9DELT|nr:hypothetical protein [Bradymonas sediminis]AWV91218.1 hypothetical protein DN745_18560 [Bradymonas sediminis]TDP73785.1 hypothetical protein DFR33_105117 [Bradymonas sediminis]